MGGENASPEERAKLCSAAVEKAIDMGCTYIDVAPAYGGGDAERDALGGEWVAGDKYAAC